MIILGSPYLIPVNLLTEYIYKCNYCYLKKLRVGNGCYLMFNDYKRFLDKFRIYHEDYGLNVRVDLTGGDLWLYPKYNQIIKETVTRDYVSEIGLMINSLWHK